MDPTEIGVNTMNWIHSTQDRNYWRILVNVALNFGVPQFMKLVSKLYNEIYTVQETILIIAIAI